MWSTGSKSLIKGIKKQARKALRETSNQSLEIEGIRMKRKSMSDIGIIKRFLTSSGKSDWNSTAHS